MRVLTYNIKDGGGDRLPALATVIRQARPDVVGLSEVTSQTNGVALARALGMTFVFGEANNANHVAWLSRWPVERQVNHRRPGLAKTALEIVVAWEGRPLHLIVTHLASRHDTVRPIDEVPIILDILAGVGALPRLLVGDLNALHPDDEVGEPPAGVARRDDGDTAVGAPRLALRRLLAARYTDCYRAKHPVALGHTYPATAPWLRLDYIFASPESALRLQACEVISSREARLASDHLPVLAEFR